MAWSQRGALTAWMGVIGLVDLPLAYAGPFGRDGRCRGGWEVESLTHRGREAAQRVVLPTEHHGACWELLGTAARDVLARRQGEALGRHCSDCVGQRDRSLVYL